MAQAPYPLSLRHLIGALLTSTAAGALLSALATPCPALAETATPLPPVAVETSPDLTQPLTSAATTPESLAARRLSTADTVKLLDDLLGVDSVANGGVSSLPSIHGLADDRLAIEVDGRRITSACSNHMNPALSYTAPAQIGKAAVWAGITPVSLGGDSIGGTISVESPDPVFAAPGEALHKEGSLSTSFRSNSLALGGSATGTLATDRYSLTYNGGVSHAADYKDGNGHVVRASLYETINHGGSFAMRKDGDLFTFQAGQAWIPYEGFPNTAMDLNYNKSNYVNGRYQGQFDWGTLDAKVYWQHVLHKMNFLGDGKVAPGNGSMEMDTRATDTGYSVKAELPFSARDTIRIGNEFHHYAITDWWPPVSGMMGPNTALQLNDATRDRLGSFVEWEAKWTPAWSTLLGARLDAVWMDTGPVQAYGGASADTAAFNARSHARTDVNVDLTALVRYQPTRTSTNEFGYARKTRSPNLYERYNWNSTGTNMITWFGDNNYYAGNLDLKPEVAHTVSASASLHDESRKRWAVKVTPYFTYVQDYINVDPIGTQVTGGTTFSRLRFANHDAEIYGIDVSGQTMLWDSAAYGRGDLKGRLGWSHGQTTSGDALYHMMPLNGKLALDHSLGGWISSVEAQLVNAKSQADPLRREPFTPGYTLINLRTGYQWQNVRFEVGIDNLFNKQYYLPLGGIDYADWNNQGRVGTVGALPGPGRSYNAALTVTF
ncbi:MAG: TonB-dependent receptor [Rhodospirillaceae bacterium]